MNNVYPVNATGLGQDNADLARFSEKSQIRFALQEQAKAIEAIHSEVSDLYLDLRPVLLQETPAADINGDAPSPPKCELADVIDRNADKLKDILCRIQEIRERLDL